MKRTLKHFKEACKFTNFERAFTDEIIRHCDANKVEYTLEVTGTADIFYFNINKYEREKLENFINFCPRMG